MLPETVKSALERAAHKKGISFGEMVRQVLEKYLLILRGKTGQDSFFASQTIFQEHGPTDEAQHHDHYLLQRGPH